MKRIFSLLIAISISLLSVEVGGQDRSGQMLIMQGQDGPVSVFVDYQTLMENSIRYPDNPKALYEGALRLLVSGIHGMAPCFPEGATFDDIEFKDRAINIFLTFPRGVATTGVNEDTDAMMEAIAKTMMAFPQRMPVNVMARDNLNMNHIPIGELFIDSRHNLQKKYENPRTKSGGPQGFGQGQPQGFLSGKSIFLSPGHGWYYHSTNGWITQRGNTNGVVEDFSNAEPVFQYLLPYLFNAGAGVYPVRERDMNTEMVIVDNTDPGFSATGGWFASTTVPDFYGSDYMAAQVSTTETESAAFVADIPSDGYYHVYIWYTGGTNRSEDCQITIHHSDGETMVIQNLRLDGFTWKDIGRYYFLAGDPSENRKVVISNQGSDPSQYVIADAVRFGGGIHEDASKPRWEMSSMYHAPFMGCAACVTNTVTTMPLYVQWENEGWEDGIYLSWHTNAPNPGTGTSSFAYSSAGWDGTFNGVQGSIELRAAIHNELIDDIRAGWDPYWSDRGEHTNWYGEINPNYNDETPGIIFEVAFHDTPDDAEQIKEPEFRRLAARAVYQGVVRYFADRDGLTPHFLPEPPVGLVVKWQEPNVAISWAEPPFDNGGLAGNQATGYRVYLGRTGKGAQNAMETTSTSITIPQSQLPVSQGVNYVRVSAVNAGGESFPTETLAFSTDSGPRALIVNGFDRLDKYANIPESYYGGGTIYRGYLNQMNSYDYVIAHARALHYAGVPFDSTSNEAVIDGSVDLAEYEVVVWIVGEDSYSVESLNDDEQDMLAGYLDSGGALFISGSEIAWDLWYLGSTSDQSFFTDYLRAQYQADSSGTGNVTADPSGLFSGITPFNFDYMDYMIYAANWPDCISAVPGGYTDLVYTSTSYGAAIVDDTGVFKLIYLGFPFETIFDPSIQNQLMSAAMGFLYDPCDGCFIDEICYSDGDLNPQNDCEICDEGGSAYSWSDNDGADCDDTLYCNGVDYCQGGACANHLGDPCNPATEICNEANDTCDPLGDDDDDDDDNNDNDDDNNDNDSLDDDTDDDINDAGTDDDQEQPEVINGHIRMDRECGCGNL